MEVHQKSSDSLDTSLGHFNHGIKESLIGEQVKHTMFTESDKRRLMSLFFSSEDILYFTYGLLYP